MKAVCWFLLFSWAMPVSAQEYWQTLPQWPRQDGVVTVIWQAPEQYHDVVAKTGKQLPYQYHVFAALGLHLQQQIQPLLTTEQRMTLTVQDLDLAGEVQPSIDDKIGAIRVVKDTFPPRIDFRYQLLNQKGDEVWAESIQLVDFNFRYSSVDYLNKPLAYEMRMLDGWIKRQLTKQLEQSVNRPIAAY